MRPALLIRVLPVVVARRAVAAYQKLESTLITDCGRATDIGRGPPDHLRVMSMRIIAIEVERGEVIAILFGRSALHHVRRRIVIRAAGPNVLASRPVD